MTAAAKEKESKEKGKEKPAEAAKPKRSAKKGIILIGAITLVQAGGFFAAFKMFAPGPKAAHASAGEEKSGESAATAEEKSAAGGEHGAPAEKSDHAEKSMKGGSPGASSATLEIEVVKNFRVPNEKSGRQYIYDFDLYVKVASNRKDEMQKLINERRGELSDRVARLVRGADQAVLHEPELKVLRAQVGQTITEMAQKKDLVQEVLIPRFVPMRSE